MSLLADPRLDWNLLRAYGFDEQGFERSAERVRSGALNEKASTVRGKIEPPGAGDVTIVEPSGPAAEQALAAGEAALRNGRVAVVVLNGGMATRFGNVVKGVVEVFGGRSFISLKAEDARRAGERFKAPVPFVLMNSFATKEATMRHVEENQRFGLDEKDLLSFDQTISVRLDPAGGLFIGADGKPSYYAPGHGDFFGCIRRSGVLGELRRRRVETILFSNVDNLGATVDPLVLGCHLISRRPMSAEVTAKRRTASGAWDKGGAPCRVDGRLVLVEGFRFPPDMPEDFLPDFSTNNFLFQTSAIDRDIPLDKHVVKKKVDDRPALQLESIACEASSALDEQGELIMPVQPLRVPRDGERGRFFPIKERIDLETQRGELEQRLLRGWQLRDAAS